MTKKTLLASSDNTTKKILGETIAFDILSAQEGLTKCLEYWTTEAPGSIKVNGSTIEQLLLKRKQAIQPQDDLKTETTTEEDLKAIWEENLMDGLNETQKKALLQFFSQTLHETGLPNLLRNDLINFMETRAFPFRSFPGAETERTFEITIVNRNTIVMKEHFFIHEMSYNDTPNSTRAILTDAQEGLIQGTGEYTFEFDANGNITEEPRIACTLAWQDQMNPYMDRKPRDFLKKEPYKLTAWQMLAEKVDNALVELKTIQDPSQPENQEVIKVIKNELSILKTCLKDPISPYSKGVYPTILKNLEKIISPNSDQSPNEWSKNSSTLYNLITRIFRFIAACLRLNHEQTHEDTLLKTPTQTLTEDKLLKTINKVQKMPIWTTKSKPPINGKENSETAEEKIEPTPRLS